MSHDGEAESEMDNHNDGSVYDAQSVPQPSYDPYFTCNKKIIDDLLADEVRYQTLAGFCNKEGPTSMNIWMRETLITWLRDVADHKQCESEVLALAIMLLDRYLNICTIAKPDYQLVGATCFLAASKIKETIPVSVDKMVKYTDCCVTNEDLLRNEIQLSVALDFDLNAVTPIDFILPTLDLICYENTMKCSLHQAAVSILHKCVHMASLCDYLPSCVAGAAIVSACQSVFINEHNLLMETFNRVHSILNVDKNTLRDCHKVLQEGIHPPEASTSDEVLEPESESVTGKIKQRTPTDLRDVRF